MLLRQRLMGPIARCALWCALLAALLSSALVVGFAAEPDNTFLDLKSIKAKGTLRIAITHFDIPPFHMRRPDGTFVGKDIDFARELGEVLKVKIVFVDDPPTFDATVQAVAQGRADIALSKLSQTYDRLIGVRFSAPYFELRHALLYNRAIISRLANGGPPDEALRDYTGKIGVIGKSAYVDFATANYPKAKIVPFGTMTYVDA
jgi:polar amino acid transport system substrate-binding protein